MWSLEETSWSSSFLHRVKETYSGNEVQQEIRADWTEKISKPRAYSLRSRKTIESDTVHEARQSLLKRSLYKSFSKSISKSILKTTSHSQFQR